MTEEEKCRCYFCRKEKADVHKVRYFVLTRWICSECKINFLDALVRKLGTDPDQILYEYFESDAKWIAARTGKDTYEFKDGKPKRI